MAKSKDPGWVKISRSILNNPIWTSPEPFSIRDAWIDLILMANFEDKEIMTRHGKTIKIPRGSTFTSIKHLADRWHWSPNKVRRQIERLNRLGMVTISGTADGTLLTLVKYRDFQDGRRADGTPNGTADGTADGTRLKKEKKEKNEKKRASAPTFSGGRPVSVADTVAALEKWAREEKE